MNGNALIQLIVSNLIYALTDWFNSICIMMLVFLVPAFYKSYIYEKIKLRVENNDNIYDDFLIPALGEPLQWLLYVLIVKFAILRSPLHTAVGISNIYKFLNCVMLACFFWGIYVFVSPINREDGERDGVVFRFLKMYFFKKSEEEEEMDSNANAMAEMMSVVVRILVLAISFGAITSELGFNVNAFIASLSIGSLAVMYAAKDMLANVFGSLVIIVDKPFSIGDWIKTSDVEGEVKNVTFRSTQIRTISGEMVYIPSSLLTNAPIINVTKSKKRLVKLGYSINGHTDIETLEKLILLVEKMLEANQELSQKPGDIRVYLDPDYSDCYALIIEIYINGYEDSHYVKIRNIINLGILKLIQNSGIMLIQKPQQGTSFEKKKKSADELLLVGAFETARVEEPLEENEADDENDSENDGDDEDEEPSK